MQARTEINTNNTNYSFLLKCMAAGLAAALIIGTTLAIVAAQSGVHAAGFAVGATVTAGPVGALVALLVLTLAVIVTGVYAAFVRHSRLSLSEIDVTPRSRRSDWYDFGYSGPGWFGGGTLHTRGNRVFSGGTIETRGNNGTLHIRGNSVFGGGTIETRGNNGTLHTRGNSVFGRGTIETRGNNGTLHTRGNSVFGGANVPSDNQGDFGGASAPTTHRR